MEDWKQWQPDPVDSPSKHRGRRSADIISMVVKIYGSKEFFVNEYRSVLSKFLLAHYSYDTDKENRFVKVPLPQCEDIGDSSKQSLGSFYK